MSTHETVLVIALVAAVAVAWYLSFLARRLDRLHRRVEGARVVLDNQLFRRSTAALELAGSGALEPATALVLAQAATDALEAAQSRETTVGANPFARSLLADRDARLERAESDLSRVLRATLDPIDPNVVRFDSHWAVRDLAGAAQRVQMARGFHNEAVLAAQAVRSKRVVRWARLAGHAPRPLTVEIDDAPPSSLSDPALLAADDTSGREPGG